MKLLIVALLLMTTSAQAGQAWVAQTLEPGVVECGGPFIKKNGNRYELFATDDLTKPTAIIPAKKIKKIDNDTIEVDGTVYMTPTDANGVCD